MAEQVQISRRTRTVTVVSGKWLFIEEAKETSNDDSNHGVKKAESAWTPEQEARIAQLIESSSPVTSADPRIPPS